MGIVGWYYLHENKELIYKPEIDGSTAADIRESDFAHSMWPIDPQDRAGAWQILVESKSLGANPKRIRELAEKWGCDNKDAQKYAEYLGLTLEIDGNQWCAMPPWFTNLQESEAGFGDTCLDAMANLCENLGFTGGKLWNTTFEKLLRASKETPNEH